MGTCSSKKEKVKVVVDDIKKLYDSVEDLLNKVPEIVGDSIIRAREVERKSETLKSSRPPSISTDQLHQLYVSNAENKVAFQSFAETTIREIQHLKGELDKKISKAVVE